MIDGKEYAKQMRENAVIDKNGNVIVSEELWQQIANIIETQQAEIERLESIISTDNQMIKSLNKCYEMSKSEAIKEFADRFDDVLVAMRDEYAHNGIPEYGLVCEVVHTKLSNCVKKMIGAENDRF